MIITLLCFTTKFVADEQVKKAQKLEKAQANIEKQAGADANKNPIPSASPNLMHARKKEERGR